MTLQSGVLLALAYLSPVVYSHAFEARAATEPYAPFSTACPSQPLSRLANNDISQGEKDYVSARSTQADAALLSWLGKTLGSWPSKRDGPGGWGSWTSDHPGWAPGWYPTPYHKLPRLALALSGGGPKAGLTSAGVVQGLDGRDSSNGVSGLLQAMTYISALSGGSLTLGGIVANNFATVSSLRTALWDVNYQNPYNEGVNNIPNITADINAKVAAGYPATFVDLYGRVESYDFVSADDGGAGITWSSTLDQPAFTAHQAPFPLLTLTDTNVPAGQCLPTVPGPVWEISPLEFGSFDPSVAAFAQTKYLGTNVTNNQPDTENSCTLNFDNAGFFVGISTNILTTGNCTTPSSRNVTLSGISGLLEAVYPKANIELSNYGIVPNPFYQLSGAGNISAREDLYMLDGGDTGQGIPMEPFLYSARGVDVIFAVDENSSPPDNITNGGSIYDTYVSAQLLGLKNMPPVPSIATQAALNFSDSAHFLGCYDPRLTTVVYLPNSLETQFSSSTFFFTPADIDLVITEGTDIVTQANSTEWPKCVACAVMHKHAAFLFEECESCLKQYCYVP